MESQAFDKAAAVLCENIIQKLEHIPENVKKKATEIRLRTGQPLMIMTTGDPVFLLESGEVSYSHRSGTYIVSDDDVQKSFRKVCGYSVHSYQNEIKNGFMTLGGNRVGFCGTAVSENGVITSVRKIKSINVRIARQIAGAAEDVIRMFRSRGVGGVLIAGAPSSGKTTLLKDLIRRLADGSEGRYWQVSVIDERGELGGDCNGTSRNDLGLSSDIFTGYPKAKGMEIAVRTMAPEILVCDEIGNWEDVQAIRYSVNSGVIVIAAIHAGNDTELKQKPFIRELLETNAFRHIVFLSGKDRQNRVSHIVPAAGFLDGNGLQEEKQNVKNMRHDFRDSGFIINRGCSVVEFVKESAGTGDSNPASGKDADLSEIRTSSDH